MTMLNKSFVNGVNPITAPCGCEAFDLVSAATFNFSYTDFTGQSQVQVGDPCPATPYGAVFKATVYAPRGYAFVPGQPIAIISGGTVAIVASPNRFGN